MNKVYLVIIFIFISCNLTASYNSPEKDVIKEDFYFYTSVGTKYVVLPSVSLGIKK